MAFPGTYNINYYKGDTLEFRVYPKDSNGGVFPIAQYVAPNGVTRFTIAPNRGSAVGAIQGYAVIDDDNTHILCAITPANGAALDAGTTYVYDIEIARADANYDYVYTLLTGTIAVAEQVSQPGETQVPSQATDLVQQYQATNSIAISWTPGVGGGALEEYKVYVFPYTVDPAVLLPALADPSNYETISSALPAHLFTGLTPSTAYLVAVQPSNSVGDASQLTMLSNLGLAPVYTLDEVS